jgi:predicted AlkP superfamily pyrophosphatase or phosphodiesterase
MKSVIFIFLLLVSLSTAQAQSKKGTPKTIFIIADGIPYDVIQKIKPPTLIEIAQVGGITKAHVGGHAGKYNQTPTISAPGYNNLITGTWGNKHNVWDNDIAAPNYNYWNIFRIAEHVNPKLHTAVFSTWLDNRTKLIGEGLEQAGKVKLDYSFDGLELDTVKYPHDKEAAYINRIDEAVMNEATRYVKENGPDLSWIYLEYTDDMGHRFGDSEQLDNAVRTMDKRLDALWNVIKEREQKFREDWLVVVTTDHGRDAATGKDHGGQSERERTTWIVTNGKNLNDEFKNEPGVVDILPSILKHMKIQIPEPVAKELDGVSFIGEIDVTDLQAERSGETIQLTWKNMSQSKSTIAEIFVTNTNNFKTGGKDEYRKVGEVPVRNETFLIPAKEKSFYKIVVKTPNQFANTWVVDR